MNTTAPLSERNARILDRYADGATLQEIAADVGLTREGVRQIVVKHGGADAEASRAARQAAKEAVVTQAREVFLASFAEIASELAHEGFTRPEAISRIKVLYPDIDVDVAEDALKASGILFDQNNDVDIFSNVALEAGVWFLLGSELRLKPDPAWAAVYLPQDLLDELGTHLVEASVTPDELSTILGIIGAAQRAALEDRTLTITGARYNELRGELLDAMGLKSAKGAKPWPPTRQTIQKRYDGWNDALESMGLATAKKGRQKGLLTFTEEDYAQSIVDFIADATASGTEQTFANYDAWVKEQAADGIRRPSPASIRNFYGAWLTALRRASRPVPA
ncbi:sigma factor-like helix-turn-helix DNA-binding protein [Microbacterium sp. NPDC056003]|uniref:sigma factor-like helix-turn-helix DNA-binding protein n=1 Tax=Microbacterium sp. NPDC056003 TaxID=3345676 RepID=UPI0035E23C90